MTQRGQLRKRQIAGQRGSRLTAKGVVEDVTEALGTVDPVEGAAILRRVLGAVERGELIGTATMIARIEGAVSALESLNRSSR